MYVYKKVYITLSTEVQQISCVQIKCVVHQIFTFQCNKFYTSLNNYKLFKELKT